MIHALPPYQARIADLIASDAFFHGRILDIGCAGAPPACLANGIAKANQLDGVDPCESILTHAGLTERWHGEFETASLPSEAYDAAYAYNVVEHVQDPQGFLAALRRVLKPGGVFWAVTPNGRHPFSQIVRAVQFLRIKKLVCRLHEGINEYPAYYRMNSEAAIRNAAPRHGLVATDLHYFSVPGWERGYMPFGLRWIASAYDRTIALRSPDRRLVLAYRLQKPPP
jgi:2-polyprenyl-3-methyl-5-hydroxy-6-metoxy-1,4-benzoquinol methylase